MPKYIPYDYQQTSMVVINFEDQLQPGTFEHALHYLVDNKLDLTLFDPQYRNDHNGRPAYDPALLLKIILYAYSKGITSSREIEWQCQHNVIFKALSCDTAPHFTTIAAFVSEQHDAIAVLFEQVLLICHEQGLLGNELLAIDGCKLSSDAAKEWSGTFDELEQKRDKIRHLIQHHLSEQRREDTQDFRDEARQQRSQQAIETLNKASERIDRFLKSHSPRMGQGKRKKEIKSNITDNDSAKMKTSKGTIQGYNGVATVDKKHQIIVDAQAFGHGQEHHTLRPVLESIDQRYRRLGIRKQVYKGRHKVIVTADTGFANETNMKYLHQQKIDAYIPDNQFRSRDPKFQDQKAKYGKRHQPSTGKAAVTFTAKDFDFDPDNRTCRCPAGKSLSDRGIRNDEHGNRKIFFEGKLLDCRHCALKQRCMRNPESADHRKGNGRQVSFLLTNKKKPTYTDWMKERVDSDKGKVIYGHRLSVVEPVFGNITINKRLNRFSLRTKNKVQGQWQLFCLVHNIEKIANYGKIPH